MKNYYNIILSLTIISLMSVGWGQSENTEKMGRGISITEFNNIDSKVNMRDPDYADANYVFTSWGDCYTPPECDVALGDVNGDGDINIFDLVQIAYYILDLSIPDYECAADYNQDGSVDILDLVEIVNIILFDE